jgi:hypothetical protein
MKDNILQAIGLSLMGATWVAFNQAGGQYQLAFDPMTAMFVAKGAYSGGKALGLWGKAPKRQKSDEEIAYVKELKRRSKEGQFSPEMIDKMTSSYSSATFDTANEQTAQRQGSLIGRGMQNSAVADTSQARADSDVLRTIAKAREGIDMKNMLSKTTAQDTLGAYGQQQTKLDQAEAMQAYNTKQGAISDTFGAIEGGIGAFDAYKAKQAGVTAGNTGASGQTYQTGSAGAGTINPDDVNFNSGRAKMPSGAILEMNMNNQVFYMGDDGRAVIVGRLKGK